MYKKEFTILETEEEMLNFMFSDKFTIKEFCKLCFEITGQSNTDYHFAAIREEFLIQDVVILDIELLYDVIDDILKEINLED